MRTRLVASLEPLPPLVLDARARPIGPEDAEALATLMLTAYRGTIDDAGEGPDEARAEVARVLAGDYGHFDHRASELTVRDSIVASATIITHHHALPFLAFSLTTPAFQRRGLARAGLIRSMHCLRDAGHRRMHLAVTPGNTPAESLYSSLGFRPEPLGSP